VRSDVTTKNPVPPPRDWFSYWWLGGLLLLSLLCWFVPSTKPNAVLGRLNYFQFYLALTLTTITLAALLVVLLPARRRRFVGFRLTALGLSLLVVVLGLEAVAWLWPARAAMDNPWYLRPGLGGVTAADGLPYGRPAHLKWTGSSRGDLALLNEDEDPHAQTVTFQTDRDGFRNSRELPQADVIVIGDSFTEAGNIPEEKTFPLRLEQKINRPVRNLGRSGYSSPHELVVLKKYGLPMQPKVVIWQVAEANDLADVVDYLEWTRRGRPDYFDFTAQQKTSRRAAWHSRSPTWQLFNLVRRRDLKPWPFTGQFRLAAGAEETVRFLSSPGLGAPAQGHPAWEAFTQPLLEAAALCRSNQIQFVVLHLPDKFRVMGPHTRFPPEIAQASSRLAGLPRETSLGVQLRQFCEAAQIPFIDATDVLTQRAAAGELVYQPFDTHLSVLGHEAVAELLAAKVQQLD
jgi:hypothetical protein